MFFPERQPDQGDYTREGKGITLVDAQAAGFQPQKTFGDEGHGQSQETDARHQP